MSGVVAGHGLAVPAQPEELETVDIDAVSGPAGDLLDRLTDAAVLDLGGPAAARADDMVVVRRSARDVGVLARWKVETFDDTELGQQLEGPEQRRPADPQPPVAGGRLELGDREVAVGVGDELGDRTARSGDAMAGVADGVDDGFLGDHRRRIARLDDLVESQSQ